MLILVFVNIYSATQTRNLMFQTKYAAAMDKLQPLVSSFETLDNLTAESASQVIAVLGDLHVGRVVVTDASGLALYDSGTTESEQGKYVLSEEIHQALCGNDTFYCVYENATLRSRASMPVMAYNEPIGCVFIADSDAEQGQIIANLERNILQASMILELAIILLSVLFSYIGSIRMRKILLSVRMAREGEYSQKIRLHGGDELSKLAVEFNKLTERLQASEDAQKQFVSDASHELKTPLASIKLLSDSILQNEMDASTMREFVTDIGTEADRLTRMTQKLLTLNHTETAENVEHEVVDLDDVVSRVFRMLVPLAADREIELTGSFAHDCTVLSAEDDIYQIVFNLVENGIKYNHSQGSVHVTLLRGDDDVMIVIEDTGSGIPKDALGHIFERFYRVDKARSRQAGGSGLGLSIVKELVSRNLGTIHVSSTEDVGTRFTVTFPFFAISEEQEHEE